MAEKQRSSRVKEWLTRHGLSYELLIKITLGMMFVLIIGANLNSLRFFNTVKAVDEQRLGRRVADQLDFICEVIRSNPRLELTTRESRRLIDAAGFNRVFVVETDALRDPEIKASAYVSVTTLRSLQKIYSLPKLLAGGAISTLPTSITENYVGNRGEPLRAGFFHFVSADGTPLTLVATFPDYDDTQLTKLSTLNTVFQILSVLAVLTIALILLRLTLTPYRKIKSEAIAAEVASSEQAESVEFAVETFQKVINELRQKEEKLQRLYAQQKSRAANLEKYNEYVLESMYSAVVSCDTAGKVTHFNRAAEGLFGGTRSSNLHRHFREILPKGTALADMMRDALSEGTESTLPEVEQVIRDGRKVWLNVSCTLLRDSQDHVRGAMLLATDLSEIKNLEAEIALKDQMAAIGEMAAGLAHQLRNSLGAMIGFVQLLKKITTDEPRVAEIVDNILVETRGTCSMVDRFLTLSRDSAFSPAEVNLNQIASLLNKKFEHELHEHHIRLKFEIERHLDEIVADELLFTNILTNLIRNAIQASDDRSTVTVEIAQSPDAHVEVLVRDQGKGIPEEHLPNIFTPFFTHGKVDGTGLGLALVRKWIHQHGGTVTCDSQPGQGTTFRLQFPQTNPVHLI